MTLQDKLFLAPIEDPKHILDIGTGTGLWAADIADLFPSSSVLGTDLSPIQPSLLQPSNLHFEIDDAATQDWVLFPPSHFDYIHVRGLFGSLSDWPAFYSRVLHHLKPGAWFEQFEFSCKTFELKAGQEEGEEGQELGSEEHVLGKWSENAVRMGREMGKSFSTCEEMAAGIEGAGFEGVTERRFRWPVGGWSEEERLREIGKWNLLNWEEGMEGWAMAIYTRVWGWTADQVREFLREVHAALREKDRRIYHEVRVVYARKPL